MLDNRDVLMVILRRQPKYLFSRRGAVPFSNETLRFTRGDDTGQGDEIAFANRVEAKD